MKIITKDKTKTELIQYLHEFCFRKTPRTSLKSINNGNFLIWPGLKNQQFLRYLPPSIATDLGHMDQEKKLQSTSNIKSEVEVE